MKVKETHIQSLEDGIILTPPGYKNYNCWRVEHHKKGRWIPIEAHHFSILEILSETPWHYIVCEDKFVDAKLKSSWPISVIDVKWRNINKAYKKATKRAEELARNNIQSYKKDSLWPYLGELVLEGVFPNKGYVLKCESKTLKTPTP